MNRKDVRYESEQEYFNVADIFGERQTYLTMQLCRNVFKEGLQEAP